MDAILRNEYEATVLTNEAIEVHLSYLRPAVEALSEKLDRTNDRIDQTNTSLDELRKVVLKIDSRLSALDSRLSAIVWVGGGLVALITLAITVGKAFNWF